MILADVELVSTVPLFQSSVFFCNAFSLGQHMRFSELFSLCFRFWFCLFTKLIDNVYTAHRTAVSTRITGIKTGGQALEISHAQVHYDR